MNDLFVMMCCLMIACGLIIAAILYATYGGVHGSLAHSDIGTVYNFRYLQPLTGTYERYLAKVINVRRFTKFEIDCLNFHSDYRVGDKEFQRTNTLVTCQLPNGDIRNFYAERVQDCYKSIFGRLLYTTGMACMF